MQTTLKSLNKVIVLLLLIGLSACASKGSVSDQRRAILDMKDDVLTDLFAEKPSTQSQITNAPGYAVFDSANVNVILASFGGGYGVVKDNRTGQHTYMRMAEVGVGLGAGVKDYRLVFVFHTPEVMQRFVDKGWAFGAQADAAAQAGEKGGSAGGEATVDNFTIYQITKAGIALQATVKGTKYWRDADLN